VLQENHNKLLLIKLHKDLGFHDISDKPEKIIYNFQSNGRSSLYLEDLLDYLLADYSTAGEGKYPHQYV
jgi:hypothetical protein